MKLYPSLPADLAAWAQRQPVFLTATAGIHAPHINVSPKGLTDTHFAVLSPSQCAYIDRTGSGCETIAHAYENGRLSLMFMSFGDAPRILRLFCKATVVEYDHPRFAHLVRLIGGAKREAFDGARAVILADIWEVQTSCGYAVPRVKSALYKFRHQDHEDAHVLRSGRQAQDPLDELCVFEARPTLDMHTEKMVNRNAIRGYQRANNVKSLDGLPGLRASRRDAGQTLWLRDVRAWVTRIAYEREALAVGFFMATLVSFLLRWLGL